MSGSLFLILSGTYVGSELVSEFGQMPPCFLPNGTQRLFEQQIAFAKTLSTSIAMLLPEGFVAAHYDNEKLEAENVRILHASPDKTIAEGLADALASLGHTGRLFLLFGDTLVTYGTGTSTPDSFAYGSTRHLAKWADYSEIDGRVIFHEAIQAAGEARDVVAGFFDFSDASLLRSLAETEGDFIAVLNGYAAARALVPAPVASWLDFGHLHTYYWSRRTELAARDFNKVIGNGLTLRKSGVPTRKIFAEACWYQDLPRQFRPFVPHFIDVTREPEISYELEYLHLPILSELYSFARLPPQLWVNILSSCKMFLELCQSVHPETFETKLDFPQRFFDDMIVGKTFQRLQTFADAKALSLDEPWTFNGSPMSSLAETATRMIALVRPSRAEDICVWHGDFHFANIFFDFRSQRVRVVDPRGMLSDGTLTMFGDARYDISKLTHSVVGLYDDIMAGRCNLFYAGRYTIGLDFALDADREAMIRDYLGLKIGNYACGDASMLAMVALLFLSMLPLHANNEKRQFTLLANGLRLARMAEACA